MRNVLFVTSEVHPLIKTGGLADVSGSLPQALNELNCDVRILLPYYQETKNKLGNVDQIAQFSVSGLPDTITLLESRIPESNVKIWLIDYPAAFGRPGNPYLNPEGLPWPDNAERFTLFAKAAVLIASGQIVSNWKPDVIHCNDWQAALVPALLALNSQRPATLFTIHNLAYQGLFSQEKFKTLALPDYLWSPDTLEFHNQFSFIKGGLVFADQITTVSPTYAKEIQTAEFGYGLEGLLKHKADRLTGIINGIDLATWNPATDPLIEKNYSTDTFPDKQQNKTALQKEFSLPTEAKIPLIGMIGRLVYQKGIDLVLDALPELIKRPFQLVILGSGEKEYENAIKKLSQQYPEKIAAQIGYDEALAHRIEAGIDVFLMPSRFEPCGLNQLYSLRYGSVPIVGNVGGLSDTIIGLNKITQKDKTATGFIFNEANPKSLISTVEHVLQTYKKPRIWNTITKTGMSQNFSWEKSAMKYLQLYEQA
ncbi:MAG: glycogen synthase GlgA, partial [Gammaproteobacteria bacterium]|nr:glycogen synthase GlgA [Gammaproteobacteria bacterium]